jgi:hypothetical protein
MASTNELTIKICILVEQSLPYVFTLKELNSNLFQQYSFHISISKPLNNSLCTCVCVCVGYVCTCMYVSMQTYEVAWIHSWSLMSSFLPYNNTLECTNVTFSWPVWNALFCITFSCLTQSQKMGYNNCTYNLHSSFNGR